MRDFKKLQVWHRAMDLLDECYQTTDGFPSSERYGLSSQLRRSAVSIPSNTAEGSGRGTPREFTRFLRIAYGSGCELETQALAAIGLGYGDEPSLRRITSEVEQLRRMLFAIIQQVEADGPRAQSLSAES